MCGNFVQEEKVCGDFDQEEKLYGNFDQEEKVCGEMVSRWVRWWDLGQYGEMYEAR